MFKHPFIKTMFLAGLAFGIFFAIGTGLTAILQHYTGLGDAKNSSASDTGGERTNILILGVDARPGEEHSRSDVMLLVSIDPELNKAAVVSIPRDTKLEKNPWGIDKICAANFVSGPLGAEKMVEKLLDIDIDYYVEMDFKGFKQVVDTLGGVTVNVPCRMYKPSEDINLQPGTQHLDGRQALALVRYRGYIQGDIQRTAVQQEFIKALAGEILQAKTIPKLPRLIKEANQYVNTDMQISDALRLASWAPGFNSDSLIMQTLPGSFYDVRDDHGYLTASYWMADAQQSSKLLDQMFTGKTVAVVENSISVPAAVQGEINPNNNIDRSKLPSPGHNHEYRAPNLTDSEGYM